ncbi:hypothetical protein RUM43_014892 [Polyplax serrata]|uniref:peptidyl-tRNA hydrolase n=1 Tax=Polyplax serrata TaxID=468196 RepID=A0AAN8NV13_POLSC
MGKGKVAAQCSHAAVMAHESSRKKKPQIFADWKNFGQPKIVVKIEGEKEMMELAEQARKRQLVVSVVSDAGRTQVASGTRTVLAIGPGPSFIIDQLTGHLKLY